MPNAYFEIMILLEQDNNPIQFVHPDGTPLTVGRLVPIPDWGVAILRGLAELLEPNPPDAKPMEGYEI